MMHCNNALCVHCSVLIPPGCRPPTLPCQPSRADQAGADRGAWKFKTVFVEYNFQTLLKLPSNQQHLVWFGCFTTGY